MKPSLTIAILCYNEGDSIEEVVSNVMDTITKGSFQNFEILLINDGSKDTSKASYQKLENSNSHLRVIHHHINLGIGAATNTAYQNALNDFLYIISGDGEAFTDELLQIGEWRQDTFILFERSKKQGYSWWRESLTFLNKILNLVLFGLHVDDINWNKVVPKQYYKQLKLSSNGVLVDTEIVLQLKKKGCAMKRYPTTVNHRKAGKSTVGGVQSIWLSLKEIIKLKW